ncbi:hypothetical protein [Roseobacter sp. HKCCA0434]|uniref:hypothetical protein n=1 Tax=Roseobacter sp. HKCCA0434 TaxID=3079297 RepID=UPI002905A9FA|nr:hypothetical protein [Roseobacter sp. HKCCA0434]
METRRYTYLAFGPLLVALCTAVSVVILLGLVALDPATFGLSGRALPLAAFAIGIAVSVGVIWHMNRRMHAGAVEVILDADGIAAPSTAFGGRIVRIGYGEVERLERFAFRGSRILEVHGGGRKIGIPRSALTSEEAFEDLAQTLAQRTAAEVTDAG